MAAAVPERGIGDGKPRLANYYISCQGSSIAVGQSLSSIGHAQGYAEPLRDAAERSLLPPVGVGLYTV